MSKYKYRIVKKTLNDGIVRYHPQKRDISNWIERFLGNWYSMKCGEDNTKKHGRTIPYTNTIKEAKQVIDNDIETEKKHKAKRVKSEEVVRKYNATI